MKDVFITSEIKGTPHGERMRNVIARITRENYIGKKIANGEIRKMTHDLPGSFKYPPYLTLKEVALKNCMAEFLSYDCPNDDFVILQFHGGGYVGGMKNAYRRFAGFYNELGKRVSVFTPDYRIAPEHVFPAALDDANEAFTYLLNLGYNANQIIVVGDSAGGNLALALCLDLKNRGMDLPRGLILMSPWTDMTASGESYKFNYENDPLFGGSEDSMIWNREYAADHDPTDPLLSPLFGDFSGFPPMLIQVGDCEMLLSDSVRLAEKAREAGVDVRLSIYEGMFHLFQMAPLSLAESKKAWSEVGYFLERALGIESKEPCEPCNEAEMNSDFLKKLKNIEVDLELRREKRREGINKWISTTRTILKK